MIFGTNLDMIVINKKQETGKVYLVGAGPGDPELLTLKALRLLKQCDVIIYDALLNTRILDHVASNAECIFVGKPRQKNRLTQEEIHRLMINRARSGKTVVRLKGGDPFIFGRGGEEAEALTAANIEWEVVPGVSAGHAVPAYAGIPLTHRNCASSVAFVTGHEQEGKASYIDWQSLSKAADTLVIFMSAKSLPNIVESLLAAGKLPSTPMAVIESGTYEKQRVVQGTLGTILSKVADAPVRTPALTIVGEVVKLRNKLAWFPKNGQPDQQWVDFMGIENEVLSAVC